MNLRTVWPWVAVVCGATSCFAGRTATPASASDVGMPADINACVNILTTGARPGADSTAALASAIAAAKNTAAKCVYVPSGTYHMTKFTLDGGVKLVGDGDTSVLSAPNPAHRELLLGGTASGAYRLKLYTQGTGRTNKNHAIEIDKLATGFVINDVTIDGSNGGGIVTWGGSYGRITQNRVINTMSDAIHLSGGAHHIYVAGNTVRNSGDDMIAVVTYQSQLAVCSEILIENNDVADNYWGRGISVVGGKDITVRSNRINNSAFAGLYFTSESSWRTLGVNNVIAAENIINNAAMITPYGHPEVLLYSDTQYKVQYVLLKNNILTNAPGSPFRIGEANTINISSSGNTYNGAAITPDNCAADPGVVTGTSVTGELMGGTAISAPTSARAPVRTALFKDGFESSLSWMKTGDVTWYTGTPKFGTHSVRLQKTGAIQKTVPLTGYKDVTVTFSMGADSLDNQAKKLEASYYNGTSWVALATIENDSDKNKRLNTYTLFIPAGVNGRADFAMRFKLNGASANEYAYIDSVLVIGNPM